MTAYTVTIGALYVLGAVMFLLMASIVSSDRWSASDRLQAAMTAAMWPLVAILFLGAFVAGRRRR